MSEETPSVVLTNVLGNICKNQSLIDESIALSKTFGSINFKNAGAEASESIERTKSIVDELSKNIENHRGYFYKFYNNWKIGKDCCDTENDCRNELSEVERKSPDIFDDSFNNKSDNNTINTDAVSDINEGTTDLCLNSNIETLESVNGLVINNGEVKNVAKDNENNCSVTSENSAVSKNSCNMRDITKSNDKSKDTNNVKELNEYVKNTLIMEKGNEEISENNDNNKVSNENNLEKDIVETGDTTNKTTIREIDDNPITPNEENRTESYPTEANSVTKKNDKNTGSIPLNTKEQKISNKEILNNNDSIVTDTENQSDHDIFLVKTLKIANINKDNFSDNNYDPLHIDSNLLQDGTSDDWNRPNIPNENPSNDIKFNCKEGKEENPFKIKCVDISKLLAAAPESLEAAEIRAIPIKIAKSLNTSIVVISDSDGEVSPKTIKKKGKNIGEITPMLGSEITVIPVKRAKKVIVLDDSNSSDEPILSTKRKAKCLNKRTIKENKGLVHPAIKHSTINERRETNRRKLRRKKPVQELANVSSLSEESSLSSSDNDFSISKHRNKGKSKKQSLIEEKLLLSSLDDRKLSCKAHVPLTRIPANELKENYYKKMAKIEINKLTNMETLKRSRRKDSKSSDSTESETFKTKKRYCSERSKAKSLYEVNSSDDSDATMHSNPLGTIGEDSIDKLKGPQIIEEKLAETKLAETLLNEIASDGNNSKESADSDSGNSDEEGKTKKLEVQENEKSKDETSTNTKKDKGDKQSEEDDDVEARKEKKKWRKDKLLTENITESDSEEDFAKFSNKRDKLKEKESEDEEVTLNKSKKRLKKKKAKNVIGSSSDGDESASSSKSKSDSPEEGVGDSSDSVKSGGSIAKDTKKTRRRIKRLKDSSDENEAEKSTRKNIRRVWKKDTLSESTIAAEKEEQERKARIAERQKKYNLIFEPDALEKSAVDKVVLDFDEETERELLKVDKRLVKHLKPHQAKGIQFMWDTCFESLKRSKETKGSGCILAHCMGLGKTLQVIALIHTLVTNEEETGIRKVLVVCPLSTVLNWVAEFKKWLPDTDEIEVFELVSSKQNMERMYQVKEWDRVGGALVLGYDMFRNLTNPTNKRLSKRLRNTFHTCLVDPGPQLVICDEGHLLKNEKTSISIAMNRLQSMRRIVLTGTPLQNNMKEYFCMVQFVKPNLLGTYKEYLNRFVNPITNGQYTDSTPHDINIMRKRSHVLHKLLDGVVQRKDYSVLAPFLPPKHEYVLFVSLTELQIKLYQHYLREKSGRKNTDSNRSFLFVDFNEFQRICTHPRVLLDKSIQVKQARDKMDFLEDESEGSLKDFIDDEDTEKSKSSSSSSSSSGSESDSAGSPKEKKKSTPPPRKQRVTRSTAAIYEISDAEKSESEAELDPSEWWRQYCNDEDLDNIGNSGKLSLLFEILQHCELIGDKMLIFSQSLYSLNIIEYFLNKIDEATQKAEANSFCGFTGSWSLGLDYFRLDGSSSCDNRAAWCKTFNDPENIRARLFLISTRAGGLGINLVAANRVIIFDVSWNPSHDTQSIYRVYRFGQNKPSFIYRFVTLGAMEMKVYERQVTKQAISKRVIDEQQIDRHYNQSDLAELYNFQPKPEEERPIPLVPKDVLLGELLQADTKIYKYHEHQSLLENKVDEVLDEAERKAAWEEFENEKTARQLSGMIAGYPVQSILIVMQSLIQQQNPTWTAEMIQKETSERFKVMQEEIQEGNSPILNQVLAELRLLRAAQEQQQKEYIKLMEQQRAIFNEYRQQQLFNQQMNQQRNQQTNQYPTQINQMSNMRMALPNYSVHRAPNPSAIARAQARRGDNPIDYIDLND